MAKQRTCDPDNRAQSKRFVEDAKRLDVDESGKAFERAFKAIQPSMQKKRKPAAPS